MFTKRIVGFIFLSLCTYMHAQPLIEKTVILQRLVKSRNTPKYFDSIAPVFLSIDGKPNDTVHITINHNKSVRKIILNNIGLDTLMIPYGNDVTSLYYVGNPIPNNVYWGDTAIFSRSLTVQSRHELTIKSFSKGDATYDTANYWTNDVAIFDLSGGSMYGFTMNTRDSKDKHQSNLSYTAFSVKAYGPDYYHPGSFICAVAQEDSTLIEVWPTKDLVTGELKGVKYKYLLMKGEYYYANGDGGNSDIVGSSIRSVNCKPLVVFTGTGAGQREMLWKLKKGYPIKPYLEGLPSGSYSFLFSEIPPDQAYTRQYVVPVFAGNEEQGKLGSVDYSAAAPYHTVVQVVALFDNTKVKINKRPITLSKKGDTDGDTLQTSGFIEADKPVAVKTYVGGIRGPFNIAVQAFPFDEISTDTMRIACLFHKDSITQPRKWKKPIAWVLARGDANSAIVYANGRKKVFTSRANKIPGNFYFDTILLEGNTVNWIQAPNGAYIQYAEELMGTGSQNVSTEGAIYKTKWVQAKLDGEIVTAAQGVQQVCQSTPVKLEVLTDWYVAKELDWHINGQRDSGKSLIYSFKDTGLQSVMLRAKRPYTDCNQQEIWDSTQFQIYVYPVPQLQPQLDTIVCAFSNISFTATYTDMYRPSWWLNDSVVCGGCKTVLLAVDTASKIMLQIQKPGCAAVTDTFAIKIYDTAKLHILGPLTACYESKLEYLIQDSSSYKIGDIVWAGGYIGDTIRMVGRKDQLVIAESKDACYGVSLHDTVAVHVFDALSIALLSDTTVCYGVKYSPTATVKGGDTAFIQNLEWNGSTILPEFEVTRDTLLQVVVTDGCSIPDTAYQLIHVRKLPTLTISKVPQQWCYGQVVEFDISASENPSNLKWEQGSDSLVWPNLQGIQYTRQIKTNTPIRISAQNSCGASDTVLYPTIPSALGLQISKASDVICRWTDTIKGLVTGNNGNVKILIYGSQVDSLMSLGNFEYISEPSDSVILFVAMDGCNKPDSVLLMRKLGTELQLVRPDKLYVCAENDATLQLETTGGLPGKKQWLLRAEGNLIMDSVLQYRPKTSHKVYVEVTDGCDKKVDSIEVLVSAKTTYSNIVSDTMVCAPYQFAIDANEAAQISEYNIDFGNGKKESYKVDVGERLEIATDYTNPGSYTWHLYQRYGTQQCDAIFGRIVVQPNPVAGFVYTPQVVDVKTPEVKFIYTGSGVSQISWDCGNGQTGVGPEIGTYYKDTGYYLATQVVKNATGCMDSTTAHIYVSGLLIVYMPTAIIPAGVNFQYQPKVYNGTLIEMEIYNRWGELVYKGKDSWQPGNLSGEVFICVAMVADMHGKRHSFSQTITVLR